MKKTYLLCTLLVLGISTYAQMNLDSLLIIWNDTSQADTIRLDAIKDLSENYWNNNPDSALVLARKMLNLATAKGLKRYQADAFMLQGGPYFVKGDIEKSIETVTQCLVLAQEIGYPWGVARAYSGLGAMYNGQGNFRESLEYQKRALVIAEEMATKSINGNRVLGETKNFTITSLLGGINTWIGIVYANMNLFVKAIEYYERALKYQESGGKKAAIAGTLNNIATIYLQSGDTTMARDYYERSLKIAEEVGSKYVMAADLANLGNISMVAKDYKTSLDYYTRALKLNEEASDQYRIGGTMAGIASVHREMKNYPEAIEYLDQASAIFRSIGAAGPNAGMLIERGVIFLKQGNYNQAIRWCKNGLAKAEGLQTLGLKLGACDCLYQAYKAANQGNKALEYHERYLVLKDSFQSDETTKKLQQMEFAKQMLIDSLSQEEETLRVQLVHNGELQKKNTTRNISTGMGIMFLLLAGGLWSRLKYIRRSKVTLQLEKDRSEHLLLNILPTEVAEELKANGKAVARNFSMVSILFTDFKEFTQTSGKVSAGKLVDELNYCFEGFDAIMEKHGIEKIKTIGDAYMAAGGLPVPTDGSARNTVLAALEMQEFISKRKVQQDALGLMAFEMRAGIHTGPVVAGIVGVKKFQYDIWGDTVNTASRMESNGDVGQVNISQDTYGPIKDDSSFSFENRGKIEVKGKGLINMYYVN